MESGGGGGVGDLRCICCATLVAESGVRHLLVYKPAEITWDTNTGPAHIIIFE